MVSPIRLRKFILAMESPPLVENELITKIEQYTQLISQALADAEFDALHTLSTECDRFMRSQFPLSNESPADTSKLLRCLSELSESYKRAVTEIEQQKAVVGGQLHKLTRSRSNTNQYLDVAANLE